MIKKRINRRNFMHKSTIGVAGLASSITAAKAAAPNKSKILNYNENMEYRRLGKTELMVSAVCLGGHWKHIENVLPDKDKGKRKRKRKVSLNNPDFIKNRYDVMSRCIDIGINYVDACVGKEILAYSKALRGRRDKMYFGASWCGEEIRKPAFRTTKALLRTLDKGLQEAKLDYVDLWRITMSEHSGKHTRAEVDEMMAALEKAKKQGKARFIGLSAHDRPHIKWMIETYPDKIDVVVTPYTARSKTITSDSLFHTLHKYDVGCFGIKPFVSNALFKGNGSLDSPHAKKDDHLARMAIRYILSSSPVTIPIPGLINVHQVDNIAKAVKERRQLDKAEAEELKKAMEYAWANLPRSYHWLREWEYV